MGLLIDELGKPRWAGGGLMLLVLLSLLLVPPLLRNKDINHPLSAKQRINLCPMLPSPPAALGDVTRAGGEQKGGGSSVCEFKDDSGAVALSASVFTTRQASTGGGAQRTSAVYQTWLKEVIASGAQDVRERPGDWAMASSYRFGERDEIIAEDHGVMLSLSSTQLDSDELTAYAKAVATKLRKP